MGPDSSPSHRLRRRPLFGNASVQSMELVTGFGHRRSPLVDENSALFLVVGCLTLRAARHQFRIAKRRARKVHDAAWRDDHEDIRP